MEGGKTDAQRAQEAADEQLAKQLQEEMNNAQPEAARPQPAGDSVVISCAACTFDNVIKKPIAGVEYKCTQCRTPLKLPAHLAAEVPRHPHGPNPPVRKENIIECSICKTANRVPNRKSDAILCGACYQELGSKLQKEAPKQSPKVEETRTLQVRCGQCSAVNAVQAQADAKVIQFECGSCETTNEVSLE
ncbi:hypothetical protein AGDE_01658 [Angomonas deanei]|uniref:Uncharacterized protein n=1 Tax=Angomonas deanei TaxID=59799 RepID=S9X1M0_9TRYP|nr:hypothetical protein AGDE_07809 [Angomonas deanei]EPY38054.1 hypothetical protein AGDE_05878 [Angomonas deanei]EPY41574.1 hypothetical protein AGDE_02350 [Angomonas deanei]EPY42265.1 hypothetical protein AGDE_01658 [Angomonas deanei]CAD2218394.1 hypothetical protein, conserved [Angomonas deanei]|eukprot:EPY34827.1 hypothetical protein AGDE_07809 [Angomonas deanei]